jgi:serine/threonine protein kinase/tetratricopeptide (TPR) repeat protein
MPSNYAVGSKPIPGYTLVEFLGRGGFGSVWKATGPGGVTLALKVIDLEAQQGLKEWRSLSFMKAIKHPNLVPITGIWVKDRDGNLVDNAFEEADWRSARQTVAFSELLLAMGLGDESLLDRLRKHQRDGLQGIPVAELLNYIEESAKALDFLNSPKHDLGQGPVSIQHCDIKPQNILLVSGSAQVCDFGLARVLTEAVVTTTSVTAAYAAPELLSENRPSRSTDQYSLAVTYYELRTGELPFRSGGNQAAMMFAKVMGKCDLDGISPAEQRVLRRALQKDPEARYPTCMDFARDLRKAVEAQAAPHGTMRPAKREAPREGLEIVPGYRLKRRLGRGSFGEVWEGQAPGGKPVALKIVANLDAPAGRQEFKSLEVVKTIEHKYLLELYAYWLLDDEGQPIRDEERNSPTAPRAQTLVIAMKLAQGNLLDRLRNTVNQGATGLPLPELLRYTTQIAEVLDFLNLQPHALQEGTAGGVAHRDIKPENILLVDGDVKIADFGLAKVLEGTASVVHTDSVGMTLAYAAPELFEKRVTPWSDLYAFAITYYRLRTGQLPFDPKISTQELIQVHRLGKLDFSRVSAAERSVLQKACALKPEQRYSNYVSFAEALLSVNGLSQADVVLGKSGAKLPALGPQGMGPHNAPTKAGPSVIPDDYVTHKESMAPVVEMPPYVPPVKPPETGPNIDTSMSWQGKSRRVTTADERAGPLPLPMPLFIGGGVLLVVLAAAAWFFVPRWLGQPVASATVTAPMETTPTVPMKPTLPILEPTKPQTKPPPTKTPAERAAELWAEFEAARKASRTEQARKLVSDLENVVPGLDSAWEERLALAQAQAALELQPVQPALAVPALAALGRVRGAWHADTRQAVPGLAMALAERIPTEVVPAVRLLQRSLKEATDLQQKAQVRGEYARFIRQHFDDLVPPNMNWADLAAECPVVPADPWLVRAVALELRLESQRFNEQDSQVLAEGLSQANEPAIKNWLQYLTIRTQADSKEAVERLLSLDPQAPPLQSRHRRSWVVSLSEVQCKRLRRLNRFGQPYASPADATLARQLVRHAERFCTAGVVFSANGEMEAALAEGFGPSSDRRPEAIAKYVAACQARPDFASRPEAFNVLLANVQGPLASAADRERALDAYVGMAQLLKQRLPPGLGLIETYQQVLLPAITLADETFGPNPPPAWGPRLASLHGALAHLLGDGLNLDAPWPIDNSRVRAATAFEEALRLDPSNADYRQGKARFLALGRIEAARRIRHDAQRMATRDRYLDEADAELVRIKVGHPKEAARLQALIHRFRGNPLKALNELDAALPADKARAERDDLPLLVTRFELALNEAKTLKTPPEEDHELAERIEALAVYPHEKSLARALLAEARLRLNNLAARESRPLPYNTKEILRDLSDATENLPKFPRAWIWRTKLAQFEMGIALDDEQPPPQRLDALRRAEKLLTAALTDKGPEPPDDDDRAFIQKKLTEMAELRKELEK